MMNLYETLMFVHSNENHYQMKFSQFYFLLDFFVIFWLRRHLGIRLNDDLILSLLCVNCMVVTPNIHLGNTKMEGRLFDVTFQLGSAGKVCQLWFYDSVIEMLFEYLIGYRSGYYESANLTFNLNFTIFWTINKADISG